MRGKAKASDNGKLKGQRGNRGRLTRISRCGSTGEDGLLEEERRFQAKINLLWTKPQ